MSQVPPAAYLLNLLLPYQLKLPPEQQSCSRTSFDTKKHAPPLLLTSVTLLQLGI